MEVDSPEQPNGDNHANEGSSSEVAEDVVTPNQTIYINNLNEKVRKQDLKKDLYAMFSRFGQILDIICCKTYRLRGQAWIVFNDIPSATGALRTMQGFDYRQKPMRIQFAKSKSDLITEREGESINKEERVLKRKRRFESDEEERKSKRQAVRVAPYGAPSALTGAVSMQPTHRQEPPNHILFVENLPEIANIVMMDKLFAQFPGYKESRLVPGQGMAFVEYGNDMEAAVAMQTMQGFKLSAEHNLVISFAKK